MNAVKFIETIQHRIGKLDWKDTFDVSLTYVNEHGMIILRHRDEDHALRVHLESFQGDCPKYFFEFGPLLEDKFYDAFHNEGISRLEVVDDCLDKALAIIDGTEFPTGIVITLDLDEEHLALLEKMAKDQGITLDKAVENLLRDHIEGNASMC